MKRFILLAGAIAGFVLGSRAGRGPYEQLEAKFRSLAGRPDVQDAVTTVKSVAHDKADSVKNVAHEKADDVVESVKETAKDKADTVTQLVRDHVPSNEKNVHAVNGKRQASHSA